jgi:ABC-type branched-subunit amino acid transport system permease subunit
MTKFGYLIFFIIGAISFGGLQIFVFKKEVSIELALVSLLVGILTPLLISVVTKIRKKNLIKS